jgi:hypothetical protein
MNKQTLGPLWVFFMLSSLGAQAGYPVFGWAFFALTILGILSLSWYRHKNCFATVIEMLIILVSAISSMAISYLALNSAVSLEISIGLRLLVLVLITYCMWAWVPNNLRKIWHIF